MQTQHCSYYGTLDQVKPHFSIGEMLLDDMYRKVLDKHEEQLVKDQQILISELRKTFAIEMREFKKSVLLLDEKMKKLEKLVNKESKNATSEGKEGEQSERVRRKRETGNEGRKATKASRGNRVQ